MTLGGSKRIAGVVPARQVEILDFGRAMVINWEKGRRVKEVTLQTHSADRGNAEQLL
jgi:hypothetical protein